MNKYVPIGVTRGTGEGNNKRKVNLNNTSEKFVALGKLMVSTSQMALRTAPHGMNQ